jgi:hypothetical protein
LHPKYAIAFAKVDPHQACPLRKSKGIFSVNGQVNSLPKDVDVWDFNSFVLLIAPIHIFDIVVLSAAHGH